SRFPDKIFNNQEIARISRIFNNTQLKVDSFLDLVRKFRIPFFGTFISDMAQIGILSTLPIIYKIFFMLEFVRNCEGGQQYIPCQLKSLNLVHDFLNIGNGFRNILKEL